MPTNVIMPQMGESIAEGTVTKWLKKVGDHVERDEPIFEISTDKVDAEIPSPAAGVLTKILVHENQTVEVNTVVAEIDGEGPAAQTEAPASAATVGTAATPVGAGLVPPQGQPETALPETAAEQPPELPLPATPGVSPPRRTAEGRPVRSSPLVQGIASEHNINLIDVPGTGLDGRVSKKDILAYIARGEGGGEAAPAAAPAGVAPPVVPPAPASGFAHAAPAVPAPAPPAPVRGPAAAPGPPPAPQVVFTGPTQAVPMTPMRKQIAEHMALSRRTSAHVTTVFEVEMSRVFDTRARYADEFERRNGIKLTYTPFFARAAVEAIKEFPIFNSSVDGANIVYKRDVNIGIAVALETGLVVPVIKRADEKNFLGVARAVQDLADRARSKRLNVDDVQGGTFTITNPGVFGSLFGTPIINQPQVAILGVGTIEKRAVVRNDAIAIRPMVYLMLSFDHRIIDGAVADQFVARIKRALENWDEAVM